MRGGGGLDVRLKFIPNYSENRQRSNEHIDILYKTRYPTYLE